MGMRYLNCKGPEGRETIDQLDSGDFATFREFRAERARLAEEYALSGMAGVYWSMRPCANWESES